MCRTYHFVCMGEYVEAVREGTKVTEGRILGHAAFRTHGLPCANCCVHVHNYRRGVLCNLARAVRVCTPEETITDTNFKQYVPRASSRVAAIDVYYGGTGKWAKSKRKGKKCTYVWMDLTMPRPQAHGKDRRRRHC